jgi:hypothetical protein
MVNALEIINEINDRLGWPQLSTIEDPDVTNEQRKVLRALNRTLVTIQGVDDWPLLRRDGEIVLVPEVLGTAVSGSEQYVTATQNSKEVTIANITMDDTYKTRAFQVAGDNIVYRIVDILSPTTVKLNRAWISDSITVADEKLFTIAADRYGLPNDFDRPSTDIESFFGPYSIKPINPNELSLMRRKNPGIHTDDPSVFTIYDMNEGQTTTLMHFHPFPKNARLLQFSYQSVHPEINSDNDKILYPQRYMEFVINATEKVCLEAYEDSPKADRTLIEMMRNYNWQTPAITDSLPRLRPANQIRQSMQQAAGLGSIRVNWGSFFDRAGNTNLD